MRVCAYLCGCAIGTTGFLCGVGEGWVVGGDGLGCRTAAAVPSEKTVGGGCVCAACKMLRAVKDI